MQAELNKYFPTDISNLILEKHYKSMFHISIKNLNKEIKIDRKRAYIDPDDSDYETDDDEEFGENSYIEYFIKKRFVTFRATFYDSDD